MTRGREYQGCVEEYTVDKNGKGKQFIFWYEGKGPEHMGKKIKIWKMGVEKYIEFKNLFNTMYENILILLISQQRDSNWVRPARTSSIHFPGINYPS